MSVASVKERGEVFKPDEVMAFLRDGKVALKRPIKPQPPNMPHFAWRNDGQTWTWHDVYYGNVLPTPLGTVKCPYAVGQRGWGKETWQANRPDTGDLDHDLTTYVLRYYADDNPRYRDRDEWRSARSMPRSASRLTFEVTSVAALCEGGQWYWSVEVTQAKGG